MRILLRSHVRVTFTRCSSPKVSNKESSEHVKNSSRSAFKKYVDISLEMPNILHLPEIQRETGRTRDIATFYSARTQNILEKRRIINHY